VTSPYLNTAEAAEYLRFVNKDGTPKLMALHMWLRRNHVPVKKRGRAVLIHRDDLDAALGDRVAR
jgi:hypothetical protein